MEHYNIIFTGSIFLLQNGFHTKCRRAKFLLQNVFWKLKLPNIGFFCQHRSQKHLVAKQVFMLQHELLLMGRSTAQFQHLPRNFGFRVLNPICALYSTILMCGCISFIWASVESCSVHHCLDLLWQVPCTMKMRGLSGFPILRPELAGPLHSFSLRSNSAPPWELWLT